jgi:N-acetylmuramoyl-L-alanine amidase
MPGVVISSGHSLKVRGASGPPPWGLDEVNEARRVVDEVARLLMRDGVSAITYHDDISDTQSENLEAIVSFHNECERDIDVSVHFNAYEATSNPMGTEVLYVTDGTLAEDVSDAIAVAGGFIDRGAKHRSDLYFLNNTEKPAILIETCFVDSSADCSLYRENFRLICDAIAGALADELLGDDRLEGSDIRPVGIPDCRAAITATVFGGEADYNTSAYDPDLVLDDESMYVALPYRFQGDRPRVRVYNRDTEESEVADILDVGPWMIDDDYFYRDARPIAEQCFHSDEPLPSGPHEGKVPSNPAGIDLSPALAARIGIEGKGVVDWEFV